MEFCVFRDMICRDLRETTGVEKTGAGKRAGGMAGFQYRAGAGVPGEVLGVVALHSC